MRPNPKPNPNPNLSVTIVMRAKETCWKFLPRLILTLSLTLTLALTLTLTLTLTLRMSRLYIDMQAGTTLPAYMLSYSS